MMIGTDSSFSSTYRPAGFWRTRAIAQTARRHGAWAGFRLCLTLLRSILREYFGRHHRFLIALWYVGLLTAGVAMLVSLRNGFAAAAMGAGELWQGLIALATGMTMILIPMGKVCLSKEFQQQLWFYCLGAWAFAAFLGGIVFVFFEPWMGFYERSPATAALVAVACIGVFIGFRAAIGWFVRALLKPAYAVSDAAEMAGFSEIGRRRVCIHEAGHALCYGLTEGIPEDAAVGVDTDSFNVVSGVVTLPQPRDLTSVTRPLLEWHMLRLVAGSAAERHFLGEDSICGAGDQDMFVKIAAQYMLAGYGEVFTMNAKDASEVEANRNAVRRLRDQYAEHASRFITENSDVCANLARLIEHREYLGCEELAAFEWRVTPTHGDWPLRWPEGVALYRPEEELRTSSQERPI
jgi:hypothetical protein